MSSRKETRLKNFDYREQGAYSITSCSVVGWLKYRITKEINATKNAIEKVFQRSFYDHIVRGRADHEEIFKYIREKPARRKTYRLYNNK